MESKDFGVGSFINKKNNVNKLLLTLSGYFVRIIFFIDNRSHLVLTTYVNIPFATSLTRGGIYYQSK